MNLNPQFLSQVDNLFIPCYKKYIITIGDDDMLHINATCLIQGK